MAGSGKTYSDFQWTNASLKKAASTLKSAMSQVKIPVSTTVSKKSLEETKKQIKGYFANTYIPINIIVSKSSLASAKKQLQTALSAVSLPQITVNPRTARALRSISNTIGNLSNATNNAVANAGSRRSGGGSGQGRRNAAGGTGGFGSGLALGRLGGEASEFSKSMDAATARVFAFGATAVVLNSVTQSFQALVATTIEVEKRLTEIQAIAGTGDEEFNKFRESIFNVASNTGQTFSTVADGAAELARQGLSATEITERLNASLVLTRISGLAAEDSVSSLTAVLNGFTSAGLNANEIVNKIVAVDTSFAVSAKDLADGFTRAGSTAEDAGLSFDELLGIITAVQQKTARGGAVIGNALKTIFTRISSSGTIADLQELGVKIDESQTGIEKLQALSDAFDAFEGKIGIQNAIKEKAGGKYQINIVSAALKDLANEQSLFSKATEVSNAATNEAFLRNAELNKTLAAQFNDLTVSLANIGEKVGQITFAPLLSKLTDESSGLIGIVSSQLNEDSGNTVAKSFFSGIGHFISGPGTTLILSLFLRVFGLVSQFARQGFQELNVLNTFALRQADIQKRVSLVLQEQTGLYARITSAALSRESAASRVQAILRSELRSVEQRLNIEKQITSELSRRGAYINKFGQVAVDKSYVSGVSRRLGEFAQSPGLSLAASLGVGVASSSAIENNRKELDVKTERINREIEKLRNSLTLLKEDTDKAAIGKINYEIRGFESELKTLNEEFSKNTKNINFVMGGFLTSILLASNNLKAGFAGGLAAAALALRQFVGVPFFEKINQREEDLRSQQPTESVFSFSQEAGVLVRESNRLARSFDILNKQILVGAGSIKSEIKVRSESSILYNKNQFGGIGSNLSLNKALNNLLKQSPSKETKLRAEYTDQDLRLSETSFKIAGIIESISSLAQEASNKRVSDLGFSSTSKVGLGLSAKFEGAVQELIFQLQNEKIGNQTLFDKLSNETLGSDLKSEAGIKLFAEGLLRDLKSFENISPIISGAKDIINQSSAIQEVSSLTDAANSLRSIFDSSKSLSNPDVLTVQSSFREITKEIQKLRDTGLIPEDKLDELVNSFFDETASFAEIQRDIILESAKNNLENIQAQRKLNEDFINKLKAVYEESVTNVRNLRGEDLGAGIEKTTLKDVFSQGLSDALDSLGIQGFDKSGVISSGNNLQQFTQGILGQTARKTDSTGQVIGGLAQPLNLLSQGGYSTRLTKDRQTLLQEQLKNIDVSNEVAQLSPFARKTFGNTVLKSQKSLKGGDFNNAISLQELAKINLGQNQGKYTESDQDLIKRIALSLGQQFKITDEFVRTQLPQNLQGASQNVDQSLNETEVSAIESRMASLEGLTKFETEVATLYETVLSPQLKSYAEILPSAVTATKLLADRITERANSLGSGPSLDALADGANRASVALLEIEKTIKENSQKTGDAIRDIGPEIKSKLDTSFEAITESLRLAKEKIDRFNANNPTPVGAPQ